MKEETLTIEFAGASVSIEQLESLGWKNLKKKIQYGLTKKDGDWVLKLEPAIPNDSDAPELRILLILSISNDNRINKVDTRIHHVYDDDEFDNLNVPLISYDFDNARNACMAVVVRDTYNPIKETDLGEIGVRELMEIVGLNEFQKPVVDALKKHSLRKSNTVGGLKAGSYYESPTKIIQIESNEYGIIQTIWIKIGDHNAEKTKIFDSISFASSREQVQYFLGHPSRFGDFWDRYDYKKLCLHFQYSGQNEVINMLTIMVPSVAPAYSPKEE